MKKKHRTFAADISRLTITQPAMSVLEAYLEAECTPNIMLSPVKARQRRRSILRYVEFAAEDSCKHRGTAATVALHNSLLKLASLLEDEGRHSTAHRLEELAELFKSLASKPK